MAYKYHKSDFALLVTIGSTYTDASGNNVGITARTPFVFRMYSPLKGSVDDCYEASCIGGVLKNCVILADNQVLVFVDMSQHEFKIGELMLEAEWIIDDTHYEGDQENNIKRLYTTGVELTDKPDLDSEGILDFVIDNGIESGFVVDLINAEVDRRVSSILAAINNLTDGQKVTLQVQQNADGIAQLAEQIRTLKCKVESVQADDLSVLL